LAIQSGSSPSVVEIDAASHGGVDDVRTLQELVQFSVPDKYRVILLDEAHSMSKQAFNALLKVLEEGPPNTVFVLLTTEPDKILETVRSRCMSIPFRNVPPAAIAARLEYVCEREGIQYEKNALEDIARHAEGSVRDALMVLDQGRLLGAVTVPQIRLLRGQYPVASQVLAALTLGDQAAATRVGREYFEVSGDVSGFLADLFDSLQERFASNAITSKQMIQATRLIWQTREHISVRDGRMMIEALITLLYGVLYDEKTLKTSQVPILESDAKSTKSAPMSLEELVALAEG
jgi:DNA polymerase-3 subunit gamma/tau